MPTDKGIFTYEQTTKALNEVKQDLDTEIGTLNVIPEDLYDEVLKLIGENYYPDNTLALAFGGLKRSDRIDSRNSARLKSNLSLMVVNRRTNEIMGVNISQVVRRNAVANLEGLPKTLQDIVTFNRCINEGLDLFETFGVDEIFRFSIVAVVREYRQLGIASQIMKGAMALARSLGFKVMRVDASSLPTQRICEKLGFEKMREVPFESYIFEGQPLDQRAGIVGSSKVYVKCL